MPITFHHITHTNIIITEKWREKMYMGSCGQSDSFQGTGIYEQQTVMNISDLVGITLFNRSHQLRGKMKRKFTDFRAG